MKRTAMLFAMMMMSFFSIAQIIYFPDPNFRNVLLNTKCVDSFGDGKGDRDADINNDGAIDISEALNTPILLLEGQNIKSLQGLSNFKNLTRLNCSNNQIEILDLKNLKNLYILNCENNIIEQISNIEDCEQLSSLSFQNNNVDSLNLYSNTKLQTITCEYNNLSHLILGETDSLEYLSCYENNLETLDLSSCIKLNELRCSSNKISYLNLKNNHKEDYLSLYNNPFEIICCDDNETQIVKNKVAQNVIVTPYCTFTPGGKFYSILGNTNLDLNNNGCENTDIILPNIKFNISSLNANGSFISNTSGNYYIPVQEGTHTIKPILENSDYFNVSPDSITVTFPSTSDTKYQDFCITPKGILKQVDLSIIPLTPPARPGFDAKYKVVITNKGNQVENGTLYFAYDEGKMDFVSTDVTPSTQSDGLLSWDFIDLLPFETRYYNVKLNVNSPSEKPPVNAGDELIITCNILDNVFLLKQQVVGSYDPNDKTCLEGKTITPEQVGEYVHYLIRFENTGNYAAENVVVKDVIDENTFDISTLQITDASHESWARINGNVVEFIFENIQLPFDDATNDGYICFKIKTKPTLVLGNELKNEANIYFDYNLPILTNKTNTVVANLVGTDEAIGESDIDIFPNPVSDVLKFSDDAKILKVEVFDLSGRLVQVSNVVDSEVNVERLLSGAYQLKVHTRLGVMNSKMVKI